MTYPRLPSPLSKSVHKPLPDPAVQKQLAKPHRAVAKGSALMEYAVPATLILLAAGLMMTLADTSKLMATFFLTASGRSSSSLSGTTLQTNGLGENSFGNVDNGLSGFSSFGSQIPVAGTGGTSLYIGAVTRSGGRQAATDPEYLFP